jgi:hypothetical protein
VWWYWHMFPFFITVHLIMLTWKQWCIITSWNKGSLFMIWSSLICAPNRRQNTYIVKWVYPFHEWMRAPVILFYVMLIKYCCKLAKYVPHVTNKVTRKHFTSVIKLRVMVMLCIIYRRSISGDHLCGLVVRVSGYRSRDAGFNSRRYHIFWEAVYVEKVPLSLVRIIEELLEWKGSSLMAVGILCTDHVMPSIRKSWHWLPRQATAVQSV